MEITALWPAASVVASTFMRMGSLNMVISIEVTVFTVSPPASISMFMVMTASMLEASFMFF